MRQTQTADLQTADLQTCRHVRNSRGGGHSSNSCVYSGKYLQLKYTVSMPEKISICLNRGREESVDNDDVSIVCARKYEMVRMA